MDVPHTQKQDLTVFIVNFNTTEMTNMCVERALKHCVRYNTNIVVLDNSTVNRFELYHPIASVHVIDNTSNRVIDYDRFVKDNCRGNDPGNYASAKHATAIDWFIGECPTNNLLILDSDAFLVKDVDFIDDRFCTACEIGDSFGNRRVLPTLQYVNVNCFRRNNLKFCDPHRFRYCMDPKYVLWDTGTCLLQDIMKKNLPVKVIRLAEYVHHLSGASWEQIRTGFDFAVRRNARFIQDNLS